mmetsp:Transcript_20071/g.47056  ORF Transcript_20071/g.47056 Transcript_20071/m.47056 type:complete len:1209 (+) Transcript_20071:442-4068(+)
MGNEGSLPAGEDTEGFEYQARFPPSAIPPPGDGQAYIGATSNDPRVNGAHQQQQYQQQQQQQQQQQGRSAGGGREGGGVRLKGGVFTRRSHAHKQISTGIERAPEHSAMNAPSDYPSPAYQAATNIPMPGNDLAYISAGGGGQPQHHQHQHQHQPYPTHPQHQQQYSQHQQQMYVQQYQQQQHQQQYQQQQQYHPQGQQPQHYQQHPKKSRPGQRAGAAILNGMRNLNIGSAMNRIGGGGKSPFPSPNRVGSRWQQNQRRNQQQVNVNEWETRWDEDSDEEDEDGKTNGLPQQHSVPTTQLAPQLRPPELDSGYAGAASAAAAVVSPAKPPTTDLQSQQQQQQQQQIESEKRNQSKLQDRKPISQNPSNRIDDFPIQTTNTEISGVAPIQNKNVILKGTSQNSDRKAEKELNAAFLDFISDSFPQSNAVPPLCDQQLESRNPDQTLYADISTSLDFGMFSEPGNGNPIEDAKDDCIDSQLEPATSDSTTSRPTKSIPFSGFTHDNTTVTIPTDYASASSFSSTESIVACDSSRSDEVPATSIDDTVDTDRKRSSSSASASTAYLENLGCGSHARDSSNSVNGTMIDSDVEAPDLNSDLGSDSATNSEQNYFTIEVRVETTFPTGVTVEGAKRGWLEFCWAGGGGIVVPSTESAKPPSASKRNTAEATDAPATIRFESNDPTGADSENCASETSQQADQEVKIPSGIPSSRELIVPLGMKQELVSSTSSVYEVMADVIRRDIVTYKTTRMGFFCQGIIEDTHEGRVEFIGASYTTTRMIWTVKFQVEQLDASSADGVGATANMKSTGITNQDATANLKELAWNTKIMVEECSRQFMDTNPGFRTMLSKANVWGSWSQFQLKTATQNLIAYLDTSADSMPVVEHTETLPADVSPREAMEVWYDYYWGNGGGKIPIMLYSKKGTDTRWIIPSGLEEELISLEYDHPASESGTVGVDGEIMTETEIAKAVYRVNNPNIFTYPVHYNRATVRFERDNPSSPTQLIWKVRLKPYRKFLGGGVLFWTKNGITLAARNLRNYLELRQVERRERQLQGQLERLRIQNPASSESSTTKNDAEDDDQQLLEGFQTIRSTMSISSGGAALGVDYEQAPMRSEESIEDINEDSDNYAIEATEATENDGRQSSYRNRQSELQTTSKSPGVVVDENNPIRKSICDDESRKGTMFIPRSTIDGTIPPVDRSTHPVDRKEEDVWQ